MKTLATLFFRHFPTTGNDPLQIVKSGFREDNQEINVRFPGDIMAGGGASIEDKRNQIRSQGALENLPLFQQRYLPAY